ncbi:MAG: spore germination protein GerPC [Tumebacillaceae bacterium]
MWNVWEAIRQLEMRIHALEVDNHDLRQQLAAAKRSFRVKKIVYHVHELHIQEMSGTMNIGITAPIDEADMEQLVVEMKREED